MKQFAIVGCGNVSGLHAENINRIGRLVAACDVVNERADLCAKAYGAKAYYSVDDLLAAEKAVDVIVVCTPNGMHAEHIIKSLQAGKDVLTESPMCLTKAAAWQIVETEKFCRRRVFVTQTVHYHPGLQTLKGRLENEVADEESKDAGGSVSQKNTRSLSGWRSTAFPGGGLLYALFSNCIDCITLLYGETNVANATIAKDAGNGVEVENSGAAALRLANGSSGSLEWAANANGEGGQASFTVNTENETAILETNDLEKVNLYSLLYNDLAVSLKGEEVAMPGVFDGLKTVETIEKIYKAVR